MTVRVRLLGPVDVTVAGVPRPVPGLRRKAILAVLALRHGEVVSVDRLVDVAWTGGPVPTVRNTLQRHVSYLRSTLGAGALIEARPPGYLLSVTGEATDVQVAERLIQSATREGDAKARAALLRDALALWRGEALLGLSDLHWLGEQAQRLEQARLIAELDLVDARLALGEHAALLPDLERLARRHQFDEHVQAKLMLALYRAGRQSDALAACRRLRRDLAEHLGIDPGPEVRELETAILRQDPVLAGTPAPVNGGLSAPSRSAPAAGVVPAQLPLVPAAFAGRRAELARLSAWLGPVVTGRAERPSTVVVVVSGTAGVGKTTLAVHWAHQVAARFPDGALHADLRGFDASGAVMHPADVLGGFLDGLGVPAQRLPKGLEARSALYRSLLTGKRVLVLLDNARDVAQVRPLLPGAPGCLVMVTSRDSLTPLIAVEGAHSLALDLLTPAEAGDLLAGRLGRDRIAAEAAAAEAIASSCARLPLALSIAAAHAVTRPGQSLADLAAQLRAAEGGLDALYGGDPGTDVRAVFSWSYRTLSDPAARLFRLLGVHPGPDLTLPAAASLAGLPPREVGALLAELTRAHLLAEQRPGRYALHDLLALYVAELAADRESAAEARAARRRMLDHYLHTARGVTDRLYGPWGWLPLPVPSTGVTPEETITDDGATRWFRAEQRVLLAAVERAAAAGLETYAWQLAWTIMLPLEANGMWRELPAMQHTALDAARRVADPLGQAYAHNGLGRAYSWLGQYGDASVHLHEALARFAALGDEAAQGNVHLALGFLYDQSGEDRQAMREARKALALFRSAGHGSGQAIALNNIGWSLIQFGEYQPAIAHCAEALRLHRESGELQGQAGASDSLGLAYHRLGAYDRAIACYSDAIDLYQRLGHRYDRAGSLARLADSYHAAGDAPAARRALQQALVILDELGHPDAAVIRGRLGDSAAPPRLPEHTSPAANAVIGTGAAASPR